MNTKSEQAVRDFAAQVAEHFESGCRKDESTYWSMKDSAPDWVREMVHAVHDNCRILPDDHLFEQVVHSLEAIGDGSTPDNFTGEPGVYYREQIDWLASAPHRASLVDDAHDEFGWPKDGGIHSLIACAWAMEMERTFGCVYAHLVNNLESEGE